MNPPNIINYISAKHQFDTYNINLFSISVESWTVWRKMLVVSLLTTIMTKAIIFLMRFEQDCLAMRWNFYGCSLLFYLGFCLGSRYRRLVLENGRLFSLRGRLLLPFLLLLFGLRRISFWLLVVFWYFGFGFIVFFLKMRGPDIRLTFLLFLIICLLIRVCSIFWKSSTRFFTYSRCYSQQQP